VTPNGGKVYVSNELGNSVTVYDTGTGQTTTKPVGFAPEGIAISPDGLRVFIANKGSNTVSVMSTTGDQVVDTINVGSGGPVGIAMSPDGKRAYVTNSAGSTVNELGGPLTLTITKVGTGIGTVTSSPEGIACGANCQARYSSGTVVTLTATADGGSYFSGWSGDCSYGTVTMTANRTCTATFTGYPSGGGGGSGGGSGGGGGYYYYGCFIATAAYGSSVDPHVMVLTDFHKKYFTTSRAGRALTEFYQKYAPPMADYISRHEYVRMAVRAALTPAVYAIQYPVASLFMIVAILGGSRVARRRWADRRNRSSLHHI
jgi:YVTN family beta-propeller protein